ncbi:MAG: ATP-binding protein [bacterium]|uniref:histidine kinase n=1 Tax=candidate division TA06 bacterium 34_109 TaxID=1635277 RepID=A0A117M7A1_UNCT6|nr:MAG: PAS/PAC sensor signal transduction histidine kinase [candidate division TA06 bacterium 32_111]KUK88271.1 MAG: PAS/PAC sensor signal transduction histidine kinase [candidate division TA06 bacterium 34_109]MDI6701076.1 ATP-binding protein [bacterium]
MRKNVKVLKQNKFVCIPQNDSYILQRNILRYANEGVYLSEFLEKVSQDILKFSNTDALEILTIGPSISYLWKIEKDKLEEPEFIRFTHDDIYNNRYLLCSDENLTILCEIVLKRKKCRSKKFFTKLGNIYIPDTSQSSIIEVEEKDGWKKKILNLDKKYKSLLIIKFDIDEINTAILQLKSVKKDFFNPVSIEFYEGLTNTLGMAISDRRAQYSLRERIKELSCLYSISSSLQKTDFDFEMEMDKLINMIIPAFQFPEFTNVRIKLDNKIFFNKNFVESDNFIKSDILVEDKVRGSIEVFYSQKSFKKDTVFFLDEEKALVNAIANHFGYVLERQKLEKDKNDLHNQLLHADRLATIGQLVAGVAHEINEPLSSILGFAQLIKKSDIPDQVRSDNEKIIKSALHAREIIKKLMFFAKQMPPKKVEVDLNETIKETIYFLESHLIRSSIELNLKLSSDVPKVVADPSQLYQVIVNLTVNAIQAIKGNGILKIETYSDKDYVYFTIEDNGMGMDKETLDKIFIPFFTTKKDGTGLGLSVVHGIITNHNGKIVVESEPGKGTKFIVKLPYGVG